MSYFKSSNKTMKIILLSSLALLSVHIEARDNSSLDPNYSGSRVIENTTGLKKAWNPGCKIAELSGQGLTAGVSNSAGKDYAWVKIVVNNSGKVKSGPFPVYFNLERNVQQAPVQAQQATSVPNIGPGKSIVLRAKLIPSTNLSIQNNGYRVDVVVDAKNYVRECNENNNKSTRNL